MIIFMRLSREQGGISMKTLMLGNGCRARPVRGRMQLCLQLSRHTQHGDHGMRGQISGNLRRMGA